MGHRRHEADDDGTVVAGNVRTYLWKPKGTALLVCI